jgi:hypothetical protein
MVLCLILQSESELPWMSRVERQATWLPTKQAAEIQSLRMN